MKETDKLKAVNRGLSTIYTYASERFKQEMILAREEFDLLISMTPADDIEMRNRLIMFSHWFLMDRPIKSDKTPACIFYEDRLLSFSYDEEEVYRALRISHPGIYEIIKRQQKKIAVNLLTNERLEFFTEDGVLMQIKKEIMTIRFVRLSCGMFLLVSYCTHPYTAKGFIRSELEILNPFDSVKVSTRVLELSASGIKSKKYNWVSPIMIYNGMAKL